MLLWLHGLSDASSTSSPPTTSRPAVALQAGAGGVEPREWGQQGRQDSPCKRGCVWRCSSSRRNSGSVQPLLKLGIGVNSVAVRQRLRVLPPPLALRSQGPAGGLSRIALPPTA
jgi:hypothetical protein